MLILSSQIALSLLILTLVMAVYSDISGNLIPNIITLTAAASGLILQAWLMGMNGLLAGASGLAVGLAIFLPFYLLKGMAAGDVKLMAAAGAFLGPLDGGLAAGMTLVAGAVVGLAVLAWRGGLIAALSRYLAMSKCLFFTGQVNYLPPAQGEAANSRFPYAAAIAIGVLTVVFWHPFGV